MSNGGLELIKQDLLFYLDKTFQFSFVYVAAVFAVLAGARLSPIQNLASSINIPKAQAAFAAILLLNLLYLALAASSAHAILKRAYFILDNANGIGESDKVLRAWELFTRKPAKDYRLSCHAHRPVSSCKLRLFLWNMDNYFSAVVTLVAFAFSMLLWLHLGFGCKRWGVWLYAWALFALQVGLVFVAAKSISSLLKMCAERARRYDNENGGIQADGDPA